MGKENVIAECTEMREAAKPDYTIAQAIEDALWLRRTPETLISGPRAKQMIETLLSALEASPCYFKGARLGIPTFTLLAHDLAGHEAMRVWTKLAESHGARPEKFLPVIGMVNQWSQRPDVKWPD